MRKQFKRYFFAAVACFLILAIYFRDSWYNSSGDRAIAQMRLCMTSLRILLVQHFLDDPPHPTPYILHMRMPLLLKP